MRNPDIVLAPLSEVTMLRDQLRKVERSIEDLKESNFNASERAGLMIQEMEDKLSAHKGSVEKLQAELALCAPKENVEDLQRQLEAWQSTHKEHVDNLQRELSVKHQEDFGKLQRELALLASTESIETSRRQLAEDLQRQQCTHKEHVDNLHRELSVKHQEDVDKLRGELVYLRRELSVKHQEDVDRLRGELVGTQLSAKTESVETLRKQLAEEEQKRKQWEEKTTMRQRPETAAVAATRSVILERSAANVMAPVDPIELVAHPPTPQRSSESLDAAMKRVVIDSANAPMRMAGQKSLFSRVDANGDGTISRTEFKAALEHGVLSARVEHPSNFDKEELHDAYSNEPDEEEFADASSLAGR
jgi:hypothetical protein